MQKEEQSPVTSHRDHVAQVYFKMLQWGAEGDILRRRIDWMADQTQGQRVLDVGCNDGVLEILLARRGFDVTGVDSDATALEFARHLLANEPEEISARVRLIHGDLARTVLALDPFDTVVIGEVLEHLEDPEAVLDRSLELVRPEGRVVITTPFGFHPHENHRQTFCLSGFLALLKPRCGLELLQVEDGYIRVVGRVSPAAGKSWEQLDVDRVMSMGETALVASQRRLYRKIDGLDRRKKQLEQQVQAGTEKAAQFEQRVQAGTEKAAQFEQRVQAGTEKAAQLEQQVQAGTEKAAQLEQQVQAGTEKAAQLEQQVQAGTEKAAQLEQQVQAGTEKAAQLEQQVQAGTEKAAQLEQQVQAGTEKAAQLEQQVQAGTEKAAQLEQQVQAGTEKAAQLEQQVQAGTEKAAQLEQQVQAGTEKAAQLEQQVQAGTEKAAQLEQQVQAGTEKAAQLEQQVQAGTEKAAQLEQQVQAGTEKAAQLEQQVQAGTKAAQLEQQVQAGTEKAAQLEQQVQAGTEKAAQLEQQVQAGTEKAAQLEQQVQAGTEKAAQLEQQVQAGTKKAAQLEQQVSRLRQRVQMLQSSASYRAGNALVVAAKEPRTLWRLPALLWRIYQAARPRGPKRATEASRRGAAGLVTFPALEVPPPPQRTDVPVVAAILDTFSEYSLRYEADLMLLTSRSWREEMARSRPAFLLVESAWRGNNSAWRDVITDNSTREFNPLRDLLQYCREHDISTVFWNKEDPPNFEFFIDAAKQFDIVFTSDADCIPRYREMCGHDRIYPMPFAAQPRLHNPCRKTSWPQHAVCFAGSWMGEKYRERARALRFLLEPALRFGLHIFDRNLNRPGFGPKYRFPDGYQTAIKGSLNYEEMLTAYRCYDVMLNTNSVTDSPTMFSRRVFECLACGTPVVSTESTGMRAMLGDHVRVTRSAEETTTHLNALLSDDEVRAREGHLAYRHVHEHHTYRHRMDEMLSRVGLKPQASARPSVSVVIPTCRPKNVTHALENFAKQSYQEKELLLVLNNASFDIDAIRAQARAFPNVHVLQMEGQPTLGTCLNRAVREASGAYMARMDDDDHYGARYISDMMLAAAYSDAEILGKGAYFAHLEGPDKMALREVRVDHQHTDTVAGASLTVRREVLERITFQNRSNGEDTAFLKEAVQAGCRIYSADRFNYVMVRRADPAKHMWKVKDAKFLRNCRDLQPGLDLGRAMI